MKASGNLFIFKNRALGDSIMGLGAVAYLKKQNPERQVYYGVPEAFLPLYQNCDTSADEVWSVNPKKIKSLWGLGKKLKAKRVTHIHELFARPSSQLPMKVLAKLIGAKYTFYSHQNTSGKTPNIQKDLRGLAQAFLVADISPKEYLNHPPYLIPPSSTVNKQRTIIFGVVATRATKRFSLTRFKELALFIHQRFPQVQILIPLSPSPQDQLLKKELESEGFPSNCSFLEKSLSQLPLELQGAALYVGNDTGLKHLCAALNISTITFFGPELPQEWHPYDPQKHPFFFIDPLPCRTERAHYCHLFECDTMLCMKEIPLGKVKEKISTLLG